MIEVRIPKEIRKYKEKLFFGLTLRQSICTAIGLITSIPVYIVVSQRMGEDFASWVVIFIGMPLFLLGYFNYNGLNFEQFIVAYLQSEVIYPKKRKYKTENLYDILLEQIEKEDRENKKNAKVTQRKRTTRKKANT